MEIPMTRVLVDWMTFAHGWLEELCLQRPTEMGALKRTEASANSASVAFRDGEDAVAAESVAAAIHAQMHCEDLPSRKEGRRNLR